MHRRRAPGPVAGALVAVVLAGCNVGVPQAAEPHRVTRIEATPCDRPQPRHGVGTEVADGLVLTAAHVVEGDLRSLLVGGSPGRVVGLDTRSDLAVVALNGTPVGEPSWDVPTDVEIRTGPVQVLTADGSFETTLVRSLTLRVEDVSAGVTTDRRALELDVIVDEGDSGSAVIDPDGLLLGVVVLRRPSIGVSYASVVPAFVELVDPARDQGLDTGFDGWVADGRLAGPGDCT